MQQAQPALTPEQRARKEQRVLLATKSLAEQSAYRHIQTIYAECDGDAQNIELLLTADECYVNCELSNLLAKWLYLIYRIKSKLNYDVSIEELRVFNKLPAIQNGTLDLSNLKINNLYGLKNIPGIEAARTLNLSNNQISELPNNFTGLNSFRRLDLSDNQISELPNNFTGLNSLQWLYFSGNHISQQIQDALSASMREINPILKVYF